MKKVTAKPFNLSSIEEKLKKGIIQLRISKTASRHTNRTMANIRDRVGIKYKGTAHDSVCRGADYYKHEVYKLLTTTEFASFSVIRNPYDALVSKYHHTEQRDSGPLNLNVDLEIEERSFRSVHRGGTGPQLYTNFDKFVCHYFDFSKYSRLSERKFLHYQPFDTQNCTI